MDALNAIRFAAVPQMRASMLPGNGVEGISQAIPAKELEGIARPGDAAGVAPMENGRSFTNLLGDMVQDVNAKQIESNQAVNGLLTGEGVSLHQAMISMEEASVSFQLMVEVRNKLLESYQELMRMQV
jgi:flagellar hook-basal body complex protein FliE